MYSLEEFDKEKTKVLKYILYKKRTENEIRTKFSREIEENLLEDIIEYLKDARYINDYEYIEKAVNEYKLLKNMSVKEIEYKLYSKGISRRLVEQYIEENEEELNEYEKSSAKNIINKKLSLKEEKEIIGYLLRKGYRRDNIKLGEDD